MKVIRKRLDAIQTRVPFTRWSDVCECVEITFDNGETWIPSPENDPREGVGFRAPALTGEDAKCNAATRMVDIIRQQVDAALTAAAAVGIATSIIGIVTVLVPGINFLVNLFVAIAGALVTIGSVAIEESFTEEVYDGLVCIFYNNIDENGQVSSAQIVDIQNEINDQYPGVVFEVVALVILGMGSNGFSNAGALGTIEGDCSECPVYWCREFTSLTELGTEWVIDTYGSWNGSEWVGTFINSGSFGDRYGMDLNSFITESTITSVSVTFSVVYNDSGRPTIITYVGGAQTARYDSPYPEGSDQSNVTVTADFGEVQADKIRVFLAGKNPNSITKIVVRGLDESPYGEDNCEE